MVNVHWKMEARIRKLHGPGLCRDGWVETEQGLWSHSKLGTHTICSAHAVQMKADLQSGRRAILYLLGGLTIFYGLLILIANWNYICELLNI